jgi:hypothetical protein
MGRSVSRTTSSNVGSCFFTVSVNLLNAEPTEAVARRDSNPASGIGSPEITWFKAVQGNDSFYLVQKAFKFEPSKEQITRWMGYLRKVSVCDSRIADRACPKTGN